MPVQDISQVSKGRAWHSQSPTTVNQTGHVLYQDETNPVMHSTTKHSNHCIFGLADLIRSSIQIEYDLAYENYYT